MRPGANTGSAGRYDLTSDGRWARRDSPIVPVRDLLGGQPLGRPEVGALGVGDREQAGLAVLVERDAEEFGGLLLAIADEMQRRPSRSQTAGTQSQHEAPGRRQQ